MPAGIVVDRPQGQEILPPTKKEEVVCACQLGVTFSEQQSCEEILPPTKKEEVVCACQLGVTFSEQQSCEEILPPTEKEEVVCACQLCEKLLGWQTGYALGCSQTFNKSLIQKKIRKSSAKKNL